MALDYRSDLGPQPPDFTPPPECGNAIQALPDPAQYAVGWGNACYGDPSPGYLGQCPTITPNPACYPPALSAFLPTSGYEFETGLFSLASSCPGYFTAACTVTKTGSIINPALGSGRPDKTVADKNLWDDLRFGETAIRCCPSGYSCDPGYRYSRCISQITVGAVIPGTFYAGTLGSGDPDSCAPISTTITIQENQSQPAQAFGFAMVIHATPQTTAYYGSGSYGYSSDSYSGSRSRLSLVAKAVIGTVVPLVIFIVAVAIISYRRRRKAYERSYRPDGAGGVRLTQSATGSRPAENSGNPNNVVYTHQQYNDQPHVSRDYTFGPPPSEGFASPAEHLRWYQTQLKQDQPTHGQRTNYYSTQGNRAHGNAVTSQPFVALPLQAINPSLSANTNSPNEVEQLRAEEVRLNADIARLEERDRLEQQLRDVRRRLEALKQR